MASVGDRVVVDKEGLGRLLAALRGDGFRLVGPTVREGAIVLDRIDGIEDLPAGWTDAQEPGAYRLRRRDDGALFGFAAGPQGWKPFFFVPRLRLFRATREDGSFLVLEDREPPPRLALVGARSCDLHAIEIQDRTFVHGPHADADYAARRRDVFVLAVQCGTAGGTCFCVSMGTGPRATFGYDLAATELVDGAGHRFVIEVGTEAGAARIAELGARAAGRAELEAAEAVLARTARSMGRRMETDGIRDLLYDNLDHPRWQDVAERCLACTNCTLVCPTCFCAAVEERTDVSGAEAERVRRWDSCFTLGHSHLHGGSVRHTHLARYRQWLVHKLASWIDQFGSSGCVGCGRCITWCPVGIDLTEEVAAIRAAPGARA